MTWPAEPDSSDRSAAWRRSRTCNAVRTIRPRGSGSPHPLIATVGEHLVLPDGGGRLEAVDEGAGGVVGLATVSGRGRREDRDVPDPQWTHSVHGRDREHVELCGDLVGHLPHAVQGGGMGGV